jgi:hypothetical protein
MDAKSPRNAGFSAHFRPNIERDETRWLWTQSAANRSLDPYSLFNREFTGKMIERIPSRWPVPSEKARSTKENPSHIAWDRLQRTGKYPQIIREDLRAISESKNLRQPFL